jgi:two-component system CheB/CheR fusion protein
VKRVFSLIDRDVGRPITELASQLNCAGLSEDCRQVLDSLERREREVSTREGQWFSVDLRPYRTSENVIEGVVITFTNVTARKQAETARQAAQNFAACLMETISEPVILLNEELRVVSANQAYYRVFQTGPEDTESRSLDQLGTEQSNFHEVRARLESLLKGGPTLEGLRMEMDLPGLGRQQVSFTARCPAQKARRSPAAAWPRIRPC